MIFKTRDVQHIKESMEIGYIVVEMANGQIYEIRKQNARPIETPVDTTSINYRNPIFADVLTMFELTYPEPGQYFFYDVITDRLYIDLAIFGKRGIKPLQGMKNNPELSQIRLDLGQQTTTIQKGYGSITYKFDPSKSDVNDVMHYLAMSNQRNLFIETHRRVAWDGIKRVDDFFYESGGRAKGLSGSQETDYLRSVLWAFMLGVIEKNMSTDHDPIPVVLVLMGEQGAGKSTICRKLGGAFYTSTHESFENSKQFFESVEGGVIVELKESTQFQQDGSEKIKAFIDGTELKYRKSYAEESSKRAVRFSLIATTNDETVLSDSSGNRRFFPVFLDVSKAVVPPFYRTEDEMNQMWAEVIEAYNNGARWSDYLYQDAEKTQLKDIFRYMQSSATNDDVVTNDLMSYVDTYYPNIGDTIDTYDLKEHMNSIGYYGIDLKRAVRSFGKNPEAFEFELQKKTSRRIGANVVNVKIFRRIREPLIKRVTA